MRSEAEIREALGLVGLVALSAERKKDADSEEAACRVVEVLAWALSDPIGDEFGETVAKLKAVTEKRLRAQLQ